MLGAIFGVSSDFPSFTELSRCYIERGERERNLENRSTNADYE